MNIKTLCILATAILCMAANAQEKRKIHIINDNGAWFIFQKIYELKNVTARDILPYVENACRQSGCAVNVRSLVYKEQGRQFISVAMPQQFVPYIDELIATLDRKVDAPANKFGSFVMGTGIYDFAYTPKMRSSVALMRIVRTMEGSGEGDYFYDGYTNNIYWKDSLSDGSSALSRFEQLDVPYPQASVILNIYELSDSMLRELGIDWLQWKNGPGADFFSWGADLFNFQQNINNMPGMIDFAGRIGQSWGGFLFAPQIDFTYVKLLGQKGRARVWNSGSLTIMNEIESRVDREDVFGDNAGPNSLFTYRLSVSTTDQFLQKNTQQETSVVGNPITVTMTITSPMIGHPGAGNSNSDMDMDPADIHNADAPIILSANYTLSGSTEVSIAQNNTNQPLNNSFNVNSNFYVVSGNEKILANFTKDFDVKQKNGIPWISELPILEYIFGAVNESRSKMRYVVTITVNKVMPTCGIQDFERKGGKVYSNMMEWDNTFNPNEF